MNKMLNIYSAGINKDSIDIVIRTNAGLLAQSRFPDTYADRSDSGHIMDLSSFSRSATIYQLLGLASHIALLDGKINAVQSYDDRRKELEGELIGSGLKHEIMPFFGTIDALERHVDDMVIDYIPRGNAIFRKHLDKGAYLHGNQKAVDTDEQDRSDLKRALYDGLKVVSCMGLLQFECGRTNIKSDKIGNYQDYIESNVEGNFFKAYLALHISTH